MRSTYLVKLHRVNPDTKCCDDTGRCSEFYSSDSLNSLRVRANQALKLKFYDNFFDCDKDVYFITIFNTNTKNMHFVAKERFHA